MQAIHRRAATARIENACSSDSREFSQMSIQTKLYANKFGLSRTGISCWYRSRLLSLSTSIFLNLSLSPRLFVPYCRLFHIHFKKDIY